MFKFLSSYRIHCCVYLERLLEAVKPHVDGGPAAAGARDNVARVAGKYGLMLSPGAPVTASAIGAGQARVIVVRTQASVPGCPDWSEATVPNWNNRQLPNLGCGVNGNIAAMIANPEDLVRGREGPATVDVRTSSRAVETYREGGTGPVEAVGTSSGGGN